jgi:hypothetical protein
MNCKLLNIGKYTRFPVDYFRYGKVLACKITSKVDIKKELDANKNLKIEFTIQEESRSVYFVWYHNYSDTAFNMYIEYNSIHAEIELLNKVNTIVDFIKSKNSYDIHINNVEEKYLDSRDKTILNRYSKFIENINDPTSNCRLENNHTIFDNFARYSREQYGGIFNANMIYPTEEIGMLLSRNLYRIIFNFTKLDNTIINFRNGNLNEPYICLKIATPEVRLIPDDKKIDIYDSGYFYVDDESKIQCKVYYNKFLAPLNNFRKSKNLFPIIIIAALASVCFVLYMDGYFVSGFITNCILFIYFIYLTLFK